jgi:hypothetical protein
MAWESEIEISHIHREEMSIRASCFRFDTGLMEQVLNNFGQLSRRKRLFVLFGDFLL